MVTNNKVLTVSYGTFSCTLEGFDDSFDTMKAIAEYFRDLAADDRYFGAEPPTPDAEMLTRIAEREIERRVQARHEAGAIVLSAKPPVAEETAEATQTPSEEPASEAKSEDAPVEALEEEVVAEEPVAEVEADEETADAVDEALNLDVQDLVAEAPEEDVSEEAIEEAVEDEATEVATIEDAEVEEAAEEFFAAAEETADEFEQFEQDEEEDTVNLFEDAFADAEPKEEPAEEDSIAAKLRRIRAVVSRAETSEDEEDDYIEDQHADVSDPIDLDLSDDAAEADEVSDEVEADAEEEVEAIQDAPKPRARVIRMKRAEFEDAVSEGVLEEADEAEEAEVSAVEEAPATSLSDEDEADLMAELAMVDAELAETTDVVIEDETIEDEIEEIIEESVEAPVEETPVDAVVADDSASKREKRRERRAKLDKVEPGEEAVDRLIEEANTKLDEPEGNRRRSAIAHLRAAVAATKAEKEAGKSFEKEDNSEAYREDLAEAVRPRKAKSAPPLKLVAEQRIDTPVEEKPAGIRPRRVSVDELAAAEANEASSNFVEFAENMGATQLPEVLEAAASYLTFVEGRKKFSRPMLMRLAYQVGDERFEREAGLRSFGQLLRDKKIEKIAGGRFTVSEAINFKPDDRAAG
ncbi:hypothetical protein [Cognatishimia activa]|uniref:hypothetical protein n=1 Tax=Cognatishimia activa TaxID=1715691 RepID=UPI00222FEE7F|nr:hypothetical protein [Cognatishimia activa]UZD91664.1 hypothetical protein M0D42_03340 [Cognatishimia activa]